MFALVPPELHPTEQGFSAITDEFANLLKKLGTRTGFLALEVRFDVVLGTAQSSFKRGYKRVSADLHQMRRSSAFLADDRRTSWNQRLLGNPVKIPRTAFHVRTRLIEFVPRNFSKGKTLMRLN